MIKELLRKIPSIDSWLSSDIGKRLSNEFSHSEVADVMRSHLSHYRKLVKEGSYYLPIFDNQDYLNRLRDELLDKRKKSFRPVINATGVILHTNLGRACLADQAILEMNKVARNYSNLEYSLDKGERSSRYKHVESLITKLTGAEAAIVVNNCAAAFMLAINSFAKDQEVVISRGELVEIGDSFRMPDVIKQSGANMIEVGTTNITALSDYRTALTERSKAILVVHPSNYKLYGHTSKPDIKEITSLAHNKEIITIEDLGCGSLVELSNDDIRLSSSIHKSIEAGVDLISFSGDKLLGGPQSGILVGRAELIALIKKNPLLRALRIDKLSLAALAETLRLYFPPYNPKKDIPTLRMICEDQDKVRERIVLLSDLLKNIKNIKHYIEDGFSYSGGGTLPNNKIPSPVIKLEPLKISANNLAKQLRDSEPPIISRINSGFVYIDLRAVREDQVQDIYKALEKIFS
ncbi:MAG: L-seryl-tRNA(Sec) selenium transferase [Pseudomonadota bacterium]|nr:L-seryl-tRNA(Sec) selenium transferase [Gammaproteobacteria bacterium]MEE2683565.1 L-seryl-tRNA(Sec) selenium transferase [Pseudomonadota bacterium]|tara:strand:+ start:4934 stop:6322 length:1389 start_codon:yes stop_codon:yes gene_type:complete